MDSNQFALLGSLFLIITAIAVFGALIYLPLVWTNKILRGLIRTFRSTASLITSK